MCNVLFFMLVWLWWIWRLLGVSSFEDLISNDVHRVCLWVIGVATLLGNAVVLGGRHLAKTENRILASFVKNLAGIIIILEIFLSSKLSSLPRQFTRQKFKRKMSAWVPRIPRDCLTRNFNSIRGSGASGSQFSSNNSVQFQIVGLSGNTSGVR